MAIYKSIVKKISVPSNKKTKQKDYIPSGLLPIIDQGKELIGGYTNDLAKKINCNLPVIVFGDHTKAVKFISFPFGAGADGIKILEPKHSVCPKFLYYGTLYLTFCIENKGYARHYQYIEKEDLFVPSIPEQERIVARIEELFSQLDASVAELQAAKKRLKVYRQAVLKEAFEGIDAPIKRLEDLCYFITKGTTPPKTSITNSDTGIPFIKVYNLTFNNTLDFSIDPTFIDKDTHRGFLSRSITLPGDVLMNIVGPPMGKVSIVPDTYPEWNINQAIVRFRCLDELDNKYLAYYLGYVGTVEKMKSKAKATAGQFNLTLEICRNLTIPVPSYSQQEEIVTEIESRLSVCDSIEQTVDTALQQAEALRQSILKQAFEGGL